MGDQLLLERYFWFDQEAKRERYVKMLEPLWLRKKAIKGRTR